MVARFFRVRVVCQVSLLDGKSFAEGRGGDLTYLRSCRFEAGRSKRTYWQNSGN